MIVKCPRCEHEFDLELETCVVEMLFECPDCKTKFMVGNTDNNPPRKAVEHRPEPVQQTTDAVQPQEGEKKEPNNWVTKFLRLLVVLMLIFTMCVICGWGLHEFKVLGVISIGILGYISILIVDRKPKTEEKNSNRAMKILKFIGKYILACLLTYLFISIGIIAWREIDNKKPKTNIQESVPAIKEEEVEVPSTETKVIKASEEDIYTRVYKDGYKVGYTIDDEAYRLWGGEKSIRSLWGLYATYDMLQNDALYKGYRRGLLDGMAKRRSDTERGTNYY